MNVQRSFLIFAVVMALAATGAAPVHSVFAQTTAPADPNAGVAAAVRSYFADIPVMIAIAACESGPRQFTASGAPLYAGAGGLMVGVFQLDSSIHTAPALALGFDITTLAGNMGYARYLYGKDGTDPWISSFPCWDPQAGTSTATSSLTLTLSLGEIDPQVLVLQTLLNQAGFTLAASGPGSPGNETTKFGALTYAALKKFQCAQGIACSGDEATTGYGLLNAPTRAALLAMTAAPAAATSGATTTIATTTVGAVSTTDNAAETASLESRIAALMVIVNQLEAAIAARGTMSL